MLSLTEKHRPQPACSRSKHFIMIKTKTCSYKPPTPTPQWSLSTAVLSWTVQLKDEMLWKRKAWVENAGINTNAILTLPDDKYIICKKKEVMLAWIRKRNVLLSAIANLLQCEIYRLHTASFAWSLILLNIPLKAVFEIQTWEKQQHNFGKWLFKNFFK